MPYVYKLTHKETGEFYIGYRAANKVNAAVDIGFKYFSSSRKVKSIGFENFHIEIVAEFFKADVAYEFEQNLIKENFKDPLCLNEHYTIGKTWKFNSTGLKRSKETIAKRVAARDGYTHSKETRLNISKSRTGIKLSEESKASIRSKCSRVGENNPFYGRKHSEEDLIKMSKCKKIFTDEEEMKIIIVNSSGLSMGNIHSIYKGRCSLRTIRRIINKHNRSLKQGV